MKLHHIGYVVRSIESSAAGFPGLKLVNKVFDPVQRAELALYALDNVHLEFVQPSDPESFTWRFLEKTGGGYHHICYEVGSLDAIVAIIRDQRMVKILGPVPAVLFGGRQVVFAYSRNKEIVEFLV